MTHHLQVLQFFSHEFVNLNANLFFNLGKRKITENPNKKV